MSALIPTDALNHFENAIYLPMLIQILERDLILINDGPIKLKRPYVHIIESALKIIRQELKDTNAFLKRSNMRLLRGSTDELFTEYIFAHGGYADARRYLNYRLKHRSEELIGMYFDIVKLQK